MRPTEQSPNLVVYQAFNPGMHPQLELHPVISYLISSVSQLLALDQHHDRKSSKYLITFSS